MITDTLRDLIRERKELQKKTMELYAQAEALIEKLTPQDLEACSYEDVKDIIYEIQLSVSDEKRKELMSVIERKKREAYPAMYKPTYFPEIDALPISADEKLRLDMAARQNVRYLMIKENFDKLKYPLSIADLNLLKSIGIVEKNYLFRCRDCGEPATRMSESELLKYKRVWELEQVDYKELSEEQQEELDTLLDEGAGIIYIECLECGYSKEITSLKELDEYNRSGKVSNFYKVVKTPDLTYEKL